MNMGFALQQETVQKLLMTTEMKQAIELLQCSTAELYEWLADKVKDNPVVELELPAYASALLRESSVGEGRTYHQNRDDSADAMHTFHDFTEQKPNLYEALSTQLAVMTMPADLEKLSRRLIGYLNESGYLSDPLEQLAHELHCTEEALLAALAWIQKCEPAGIGARNLQECLLLQLAQVHPNHRALVERLLAHHLEDLGDAKWTRIAKAQNVSITAVQDAFDAIRRLNPRPGLAYDRGPTPFVVPDVEVREVGGQFVVMSNDAAMPRLRVQRTYASCLQGEDVEAKRYVAKRLQSAEWLVRCLEQRRMTLYRVTEAIVEVQSGYLRYGSGYLRPLTLRNIAERIGVHESTVSRATRGKYALTPKGLVELKTFFSSELGGSNGGASVSSETARHHIKDLIGAEDRAKPLSDEALAKRLKVLGVELSRRTVAKYREELGILPSWRRKRA